MTEQMKNFMTSSVIPDILCYLLEPPPKSHFYIYIRYDDLSLGYYNISTLQPSMLLCDRPNFSKLHVQMSVIQQA